MEQQTRCIQQKQHCHPHPHLPYDANDPLTVSDTPLQESLLVMLDGGRLKQSRASLYVNAVLLLGHQALQLQSFKGVLSTS